MEGTTPPPEPDATPPTPPEPEPPQIEQRTVTCGNCKTSFDFPIKRGTQSFKFNCTNCNALNEVTL